MRILEREVQDRVHLNAPRITCGSIVVHGDVDVLAGDKQCPEVMAEGPVTVTVKNVKRTYEGRLLITTDGARLTVVNLVDVEDYLPSVVEAEAGGSAPAMLEAQAVASRSFAVTARRHGEKGYHLCDLAHCQVYRGTTASEASSAAVKATAGRVLMRDGAMVPVYFHASCGGHTSSALEVFGEAGGVSGGVRDESCAGKGWTFETTRGALAKAFNVKPGGIPLLVERRDAGGRALTVRVFGRKMSAEAFLSTAGRNFGWGKVRSAKFDVKHAGTKVLLAGSGAGHGVGLCQQGAQALAGQGASAVEILEHYFPGAQAQPWP